MIGLRKFVLLIGLIQACSTTLTGKIVNEAGEPIRGPDARVNISQITTSNRPGVSQVVELLDDGSFTSTADLPEGSYLIEALVPGYTTNSQSIDITKVRHVELVLKAMNATQLQTIGTGNSVEFSRGSGTADLMPPNL